jgi:LysM repeat protein
MIVNWLKTAVIVALLAALGFGVYIAINKNEEAAPPPGLAQQWSDSPSVQIPGPGASGFQFDASGSGATMSPSAAGVDGLGPPAGVDPSSGAAGYSTGFPSARTDGLPGYSGPSSGGAYSLRPTDAMPTGDPSYAGSGPNDTSRAFANLIEAAYRDLEAGKLAEVHQTLSLWYENPQLTADQNRRITDLLDQLAGAVIYSQRHLLKPPHVVKPGETLPQIAAQYRVPPELLAKINGIRDPENLAPGQQLKVVEGPFEAVVHLDRYELTLMVGGLYAGRFQIGIGRDQQDLAGSYLVEDKRVVQTNDPYNPLGQYWIQLNDRIGIHGTNDLRNIGTNRGLGSICLGDQDIEDLHDILSIGSRVQILR